MWVRLLPDHVTAFGDHVAPDRGDWCVDALVAVHAGIGQRAERLGVVKDAA